MTEFLTDAWLEAMADAARRSPDGEPGPADGPGGVLVVQQVVGDASSEVAWFVEVRGAGVSLHPGRHDRPDITFTQDLDTAAAIASGRQSAPGAFMSGRLRVGGDVRILIEHQEELARLDDVFAEVRAATTYPVDPDSTELRRADA